MPRAQKHAEKGERTRLAILKSAVELFGEKGYRATSISQIAKRAGVVQSALHHHFGAKEMVLEEALKLHYPSSVSRPDMMSVAAGKTEFVDELMAAARRNIRDPELVRFFSVMTGESLTPEHPAHGFFVNRYDVAREGFTDAIAQAKGVRGEAGRAEISLLVSTLFAASDGLQMQWLRNPQVDFLGGLERVAAMVRDGLNSLEQA
ncbi:TetR family transcriptional regulator [Agrobacterium sp. 22-209-1]|uniref:TetR/AcrR family transcriptional regulator n=1 Tax=Rhizobium rhizogenes TaxID=359 RepID=UPI00157325F0|nr:TetR/AcrR family transcriptional regulator [Rhizobium rhizogenes]NTI78429.1 TetR/AcrR family transcriptional regulator [Rhizobium rhizogenes]